MTQWAYEFDHYTPQKNLDIRDHLGGKGAGLVEMTRLGLPVPPGFVVSTDVCKHYYKSSHTYPPQFKEQVEAALKGIEAKVEAFFGHHETPLLVSVRSGAKASMPGMMDTVLNLGLNDVTVEALTKQTQDARFAYDSYRRFIQMFSNVVLGIGLHHFEDILVHFKEVRNVKEDADLSAEDLKNIVTSYKKKVEQVSGTPFPQNVYDQLWGAIKAVFGSWMNQRAISYRKLYNIPEDWGTAVIVQAMVFGNQGETSATGVAFTRNPSTGKKEFFGEYLINAQGEDVVAGIRTPQPLTNQHKASPQDQSMEDTLPDAFQELCRLQHLLETHYHDMQDIEFTVQRGKLWLLQTRNGKRTAAASLRIAVDMVAEGLIDKNEAIRRFDPLTLDQLLHPTFTANTALEVLTKGLPASPGAAVGHVVFTADECEEQAAQGRPMILVREETSPEDIHGMAVAKGILTSCGGMTSHAAVVARGMGRPCVAGAGDVHIDMVHQIMTIKGVKIKAGDMISLNGSTGEVMLGEASLVEPEISADFLTLMQWSDDIRRMKVRANAETPLDAETARKFGAEGIGLCRTEHMFFDADRIQAVREMILSTNEKDRRAALSKIMPMQRGDFAKIFKAMAGLPVTIRLLDPPLHEFLPRGEMEIEQLARVLSLPLGQVKQRLAELHESNPMLGHRGCRLGVTYPEIYEMQVQAILEAALSENHQIPVEIMIPLVGFTGEFLRLKDLIDATAKKVFESAKKTVPYIVGTMIELPRAALKAGKIAHNADFFSFGTNDLTQTTLGLSRDDAGSFLTQYRSLGILNRDPFASLDQSGVGELVALAAERAKETKPTIKLGVCGEHGGDPESIYFFESVGLDYISCSPYRVPIARLSAAQAVLKERSKLKKAA